MKADQWRFSAAAVYITRVVLDDWKRTDPAARGGERPAVPSCDLEGLADRLSHVGVAPEEGAAATSTRRVIVNRGERRAQ